MFDKALDNLLKVLNIIVLVIQLARWLSDDDE